jgi:hypothetical protein
VAGQAAVADGMDAAMDAVETPGALFRARPWSDCRLGALPV